MAWWKRYEQFKSFDESPLSMRRQGPLVGHTAALEFAKATITEGKAGVIFGLAGLGKSTIAKHLVDTVKNHRLVLLNAKKHAGEPFSLQKYLKRPLFRFPKKPTCLLVDEANLLHPSMVDRIFYYFDEEAHEKYGIKSLLFFQVDDTLKNTSLPNRARMRAMHQIERLNPSQICNIVHDRLAGIDVIDEDAFLAIIHREAYNPRDVLVRLDAVLETAQEKIRLPHIEESFQKDALSSKPDQTDKAIILDENRLARKDVPFHLSELQHAIVRHLLLAEKGSVGSIAEAIGNPYGSVGKQLHLLHKRNIVTKMGACRPVQYSLCQEAKAALMTD